MTLRHVIGCLVAALSGLTLTAVRVKAHEVGTTSITATLDGTRYAIELTVDPQSLLSKLDATAGRPRSGSLTPEESLLRIAQHKEELLPHVAVRFDGQVMQPVFDHVALSPDDVAVAGDPLASRRVVIHLSGDGPSGARAFTWSYGLTFVSYPLILKQDRSNLGRLEWLEGAQVSQPFEVSAASAIAGAARELRGYVVSEFTGIITTGSAQILFGLFVILTCAMVARSQLFHAVERRDSRCNPVEPGSRSSRNSAVYAHVRKA